MNDSPGVAAVDIGTNSVRMLVTDAAGRELERRMRITRLGEGVDAARALAPLAIARTLAVLAEYGELARSRGVVRIRAAATSATRDSRNREEFFDEVERVLGARPELLSGEEEALLSFRGATAEIPRAQGPLLVFDIGGGSTEFILGTEAPEAMISLQLGCVRMAERHLKSDPARPEEIAACVADVRRELERAARVIDVRRARKVVGLAGTVTAVAALELGLDHYDAARTHHSRLSLAAVERAFERLAAADLAMREKMLAEPGRARVIVGGAAVLITILREWSIPELLVSEHDILDGLAASLR
jgi:exopolyphosphatase/guanosine-5'-triphosphate,3'-diphosphate pyrophosphatase